MPDNLPPRTLHRNLLVNRESFASTLWARKRLIYHNFSQFPSITSITLHLARAEVAVNLRWRDINNKDPRSCHADLHMHMQGP